MRWKGELDNTLVLFTSDHGDMVGDYGLFFKSQFFEGAGRVPMILRPPKTWEGVETGLRYEKPVSLVDVLATLVDAAGDVPDHVDGISLLPSVYGNDPIGNRIFHGEIGNEAQRHHCLTDGQFKYMWFRLGGREYLFDLENDPQELNNLIADEALVRPWRTRLLEILEARQDNAAHEGELVPTPHEPTPVEVRRAIDPFGRRPY